jgi:hypothetical protein
VAHQLHLTASVAVLRHLLAAGVPVLDVWRVVGSDARCMARARSTLVVELD